VTVIPTDRHITYQRQFRKCGKANCYKCKEKASHGPYWYAFWRNDNGRLRSGYIGKFPPAQLQTSAQQTEGMPDQQEERRGICTEQVPA
jgi:hypothetical protein